MKVDKMRLEILARMVVASLLAFSLSIAYLPRAVPPLLASLLAPIASSLIASLPRLLFVVGAVLPLMMVYVLLGLLGATALMACATVSDGLFLAAFSIYTFVATGLYFGENSFKLWGGVSALIAGAGILAISFRVPVQDGLTFSTPLSSDEPDDGRETPHLSAYDILRDEILDALKIIYCLEEQQSIFGCEAPDDFSGQTTLPSDIPYAFAGQTAYVTVANNTLTVNTDGGLWLVKAFWTEQGLQNPLALFRNALIIICWACFCGIVPILLPPIHTLRGYLSRGIVPAVIRQFIQMLQMEQSEMSEEHIRKGMHLWHSVSDADKVNAIIFEPRICQAPLEYLVPDLQSLLLETDRTLLEYLVLFRHSRGSREGSAEENPEVDAAQNVGIAVDLLKSTGKALQTSDPQLIMQQEQVDSQQQSEDPGSHNINLYKLSQRLATAAITWLHALEVRNGDVSNMGKIYLPWIILPLSPFIRFFQVVLLPFQPSKWRVGSIIWSLKFTTGFVALAAMEVYWKEYSKFAVQNSNIAIAGVFSGWAFFAYAFTWLPTVEGTFKRGLQRIVGTCLGGFAAWLGIIVASWSFDDNADINPYALTVWLTVLTVATCFLAVEPGILGLVGAGRDHGYVGLFFAVNMSLIALEVYTSGGSKGDLTANRIASNVTGIAMAIVLAMVPPVVSGTSPSHARKHSTVLNDAFAALIEMIVDEDTKFNLDTFTDSYLLKAKPLRRQAIFFYKDAATLEVLPFFKADKELHHVLEDLTASECMLQRLASYCSRVESVDLSHIRAAVKDTMLGDDDVQLLPEEDQPTPSLRFVSYLQAIQRRLKKADARLDTLSKSRPIYYLFQERRWLDGCEGPLQGV